MNTIPLREYQPNSPEAVARVAAMALVADGRLSDPELALVRHANLHLSLGLSPEAFATLLHDYLVDLALHSPQRDRLKLIEPAVLDQVLDAVTERREQFRVCALVLNLIDADGELAESERAVFAYMLQRWQISLGELRGYLGN